MHRRHKYSATPRKRVSLAKHENEAEKAQRVAFNTFMCGHINILKEAASQ